MSVFLCHAWDDKVAVRRLATALREAGFSPWFDEERLLPGQEWELEIARAVRAAAAVVVCLSRAAVSKTGYVQNEVRFALDVAHQQPEGAIYIIPCKLDDVDVPDRLRRWQWVDIRDPHGFEKLTAALRYRYSSLNLAPDLGATKAAAIPEPAASKALLLDPVGKKVVITGSRKCLTGLTRPRSAHGAHGNIA